MFAHVGIVRMCRRDCALRPHGSAAIRACADLSGLGAAPLSQPRRGQGFLPKHVQIAAYALQVTIDAKAEYERIRTKYAPARPRDVVIFAIVIGLLGAASIFRQIDWPFMLGGIIGFMAWEFTKLRLRRNARDFAQASR